MKRIFLNLLIVSLSINLPFAKEAYGAVDQILNDNFYQNPATLSLVKKIQVVLGNVLISPTLRFRGITSLGSGHALSKTYDALPYLLTTYRFTDRLVLGLNITPSAYGHINWPLNSIVAQNSTVTHLLYYRGVIQLSYQFTEKLALGVGANLEDNRLAELDFVVPNRGNQINKVSGINHTFDLGLFYKINSQNSLTVALYTPVNNAFGHGSSSQLVPLIFI